MKCEKCKKEITIAYGVLAKNKKRVLNLCWECYQKYVKVKKNYEKRKEKEKN